MLNSNNGQDQIKRLLATCADLFDKNETFSFSDSVIATAIKRFKGNDTIQSVLPKVILINSFYSTQIYDTGAIARHILNIDVDERLVSGDLSVVTDIRRGHGIKKKKTGTEIDFFSFSTKYAALHEPAKYPIFDSLVMRLLTKLNQRHQFCSRFTQIDLRDYSRYVSVVNSLLEFAKMESFKYKRLDQGLWIYAKYLFEQSNLTRLEIEQIAGAESQV